MSKLLKMGVAAVLAAGLISAGAALYWYRPTKSDQASARPLAPKREPLAVADRENRPPTAIAVAHEPAREQVPAPGVVPRQGPLRIARLKHAGDWNLAPRAVTNLIETLRKPPFKFGITITSKDLFAHDPNLIYYPIVYVSGRDALQLAGEDIKALREHP